MTAKQLLVRVLEGALGRKNLVRLSRYLLDSARLDVPNRVDVNGERLLQAAILAREGIQQLTVVDVGANIGQWTLQLATEAARLHRESAVVVHAFEPAAFTFERLLTNVATVPISVVPVRMAVTDDESTAMLYKIEEGAGANSLVELEQGETETVTTTTLDRYCSSTGITSIDLLKSDAEGSDIRVLKGAQSLLAARAISVLQFEYNHRWIGARAFLRDAFDCLMPHGYRVGKLTPRGIEWYPRWDWELETYREGNYVAALEPDELDIPAVPWWKAVS